MKREKKPHETFYDTENEKHLTEIQFLQETKQKQTK